MFAKNLFTYNEPKIISAVPLAEIKEYLHELGSSEKTGLNYEHNGLGIAITPCNDNTYPDLGLPRHVIEVQGDPEKAEEFLSAFRFRFLSAGG